MADIAKNLWSRDLIQQWKTPITSLPTSGTSHKVRNAAKENIEEFSILNIYAPNAKAPTFIKDTLLISNHTLHLIQ